jgi:adenosylcobinamide kinase / adenosylcobinamide-phosphate guanylyltransferase
VILIIGGTASGRHAYVSRTYGPDFSGMISVSAEDAEQFDVALPLPDNPVLLRLCAVPVVIATECGCGLIPLTSRERRVREQTGRLNCALAERAEHVIRIICGIPQVIK